MSNKESGNLGQVGEHAVVTSETCESGRFGRMLWVIVSLAVGDLWFR
jgi:hypothetical protein